MTFALPVMVASAAISRLKFKFMAINAHVFDLYFFFKNPDIAERQDSKPGTQLGLLRKTSSGSERQAVGFLRLLGWVGW